MHVLITCKYQKDRIENNQEKVETQFSPLQVYGVIFRCSTADNPRVSGPIWPKFEHSLDIMHLLVNYKFKTDWLNEREKVATSIFKTLKGNLLRSPFSDLVEYQTHPSSHVCYRFLQV